MHGFHLSDADHRLLRGAPPEAALQWAAAAVGTGAHVRSVTPLEGGTSSAVHALVVEDGAGARQELILRRFVRAKWRAEEPDVPRREAAVLEVLRASAVPAPRLVAVDPEGTCADVPAVLMTRLPGRIDWSPADLPTYLRRLAAPLPLIHAMPVPSEAPIPPYAPYALDLHRAPRWSSRPGVWSRAIEVLEGPAPTHGDAFIHRDYHPGNVLWVDGQVSGVVDWPCGSIGVPEADVGHCRMNLNGRFGAEAADRFLELYQALTGRTVYHPYWDIVAAIGGMDETIDDHPDPTDERFVAAAVARL